MIDVLFLDGTWCPRGGSRPAEVFKRRLDPARFRFRYVEYPAAYGDPMPYVASMERGALLLLDAVADSPNPAIIGGYSQGAAAAFRVAAGVSGVSRRRGLDIRGVVTIANPHEPVHRRRAGIAGDLMRPLSAPLLSAVAPGDPIADLPLGNPLRSIADLSRWATLSTPGGVRAWAEDVLGQAVDNSLQPWWAVANARGWVGAAAYAKGYLIDNRHTDAYVSEGHAASLADRVNRRQW